MKCVCVNLGWWQTAIILGCALWIALCLTLGNRQIIINTSPSVTPGLYWKLARKPCVGDLVDFRIPTTAKPYIQARTNQICDNWFLLKPIVAGSGDLIDTTGDHLLINGKIIGPMPENATVQTRSGPVALPIWLACRLLEPGEFFLYSGRISNSFDSRCFGPIHDREITAVRQPLLMW